MIESDSSFNEIYDNDSNYLQYYNQMGFFRRADQVKSFASVIKQFSTSFPIAFYVPFTDSIYIIMEENSHRELQGMMSNSEFKPILVHEMMHALQDQALRAFDSLNFNSTTTDQYLAIKSVVEGDAQFVELIELAKVDFRYNIDGHYSSSAFTLSKSISDYYYSLVDSTLSGPLEFILTSYAPYYLGALYIGNMFHYYTWENVNKLYTNFPSNMSTIVNLNTNYGLRQFYLGQIANLIDTSGFYISDVLGPIELYAALGGIPNVDRYEVKRCIMGLESDAILYGKSKTANANPMIWAMNFNESSKAKTSINFLNDLIRNVDYYNMRDRRILDSTVELTNGSYSVFSRDTLRTVLIQDGPTVWWIENISRTPDQLVAMVSQNRAALKRKSDGTPVKNAILNLRKKFPFMF